MPKFNNSLSSKLPKIGTSIFTVMSSLANEEGALNMSQGFPDFDVDPKLIELVTKNMQKGNNQYAPMQGALRLREALSHKIDKAYGVKYSPDSEITITAGATQAIFTAISAFVKEDDEVIIFTPAYDCYQPAIELNGGKAVFIQLHAPAYKIEHESICKYPGLIDRSIATYSFGKTFHVTGWKMGYCIGPKNLMHEFRKVHQFNVFSCNHPFQIAIAEYLEDENNYNNLGSFYQKKRDLFLDAVSTSRFEPITCEGTYFQLLKYDQITDEKDVDFAVRLTKEFGLASIPVSVFYHIPLDEKVLRFCFAKGEDTLQRAGEILAKV
jgi:methionine transaminase